MQIKVTQEDIDKGTKRSCTLCPVALAVKRQFLKSTILVCEGTIDISKELIYDTPYEVAQFICNFDAGNLVEPFEFEL